ncbi:hypothetical protein YC2023_063596 [Brassica napus]
MARLGILQSYRTKVSKSLQNRLLRFSENVILLSSKGRREIRKVEGALQDILNNFSWPPTTWDLGNLASTKMSVNSRRARVACVIPSRLSSTSSRRALHAIHELDQGPTRPRHGTTLLQSLRF